MVVSSDNSHAPRTAQKADNGAINDVTIPSIDSARKHTNPIALFNDDYTQCNGILSEMSPACASAASTNKRTANEVGRMRGVAFSSPPLKKKHAYSTAMASHYRAVIDTSTDSKPLRLISLPEAVLPSSNRPSILEQLPDSVLCGIASYLDPKGLIQLAYTASRFGKKKQNIDVWKGMDLCDEDGNPMMSLIEYVAYDLVKGYVDYWVFFSLPPLLTYHILHYNLCGINCTIGECNCEDDYCGWTKSDIREDIEYRFPFLGEKCYPCHCVCGLLLCGIMEDDFEIVDSDEDSIYIMDAEVQEEADTYLRKLEFSMEEEAEYLLNVDVDHYYNNDWPQEWDIR